MTTTQQFNVIGACMFQALLTHLVVGKYYVLPTAASRNVTVKSTDTCTQAMIDNINNQHGSCTMSLYGLPNSSTLSPYPSASSELLCICCDARNIGVSWFGDARWPTCKQRRIHAESSAINNELWFVSKLLSLGYRFITPDVYNN